jgi:hypothetical protein
MDDDRIQDLIRDVARHGESIRMDTSGAELRGRSTNLGPQNLGTPRVDRRSPTGRRPFAHAAAIAWFFGIAALVVAAVVLVGVPSSRHQNSQADSTTTTTNPRPATTTTIPRPAPSGRSETQVALGRAVATTDSTGNFDLSLLLTGGSGLDSGSGLTGNGAADLDPIAMTLNQVAGADLAFGPDNAWEQLGGPGWQEYTIPAFASYADGVVGTTAGALGTFAFCSPTGLFDLTQSEIGPTTEVGTQTVDGQPTTEYAVTIDPSSFLAAPGISPGETEAMQSAIGLLGDGSITDDVYVDATGDIVRTVSSIDGASLQVDLSNFGTAGTVTLPPQQSTIDSSTASGGRSECVVSGMGSRGGSSVTTTTAPGELTTETTETTRTCTEPAGSSNATPGTTIPSTTATTAATLSG